MKVTGETFSFIQKEKKSRRGKIPKVFKLSGQRTDQESNKLFYYTVFFSLCKNISEE